MKRTAKIQCQLQIPCMVKVGTLKKTEYVTTHAKLQWRSNRLLTGGTEFDSQSMDHIWEYSEMVITADF